MRLSPHKQRIYASLLMLGASILLFRTIRMIFVEGAFQQLVGWVAALLVLEFILDLLCIVTSFRWLLANSWNWARLPLRLAAYATLLHAFRVLIYVIGRVGPCYNFDVRPEYHHLYTFDWFWVYFAAALSAVGIVGVLIIWLVIKYKSNKK
jgi:hypothetical protein